uniref:Uncharacterized protein n=1 Tax=Lepeophtheirus salmonis TaxID=72036 RepID=A0A0K2UWI1_LEPSM
MIETCVQELRKFISFLAIVASLRSSRFCSRHGFMRLIFDLVVSINLGVLMPVINTPGLLVPLDRAVDRWFGHIEVFQGLK